MEKGNKNNSCEIALIGYTQAGKTTLAVGLYATSTEDFTVTGIGEETNSYLRERKAMLESGQWLNATSEQQMPNIRMLIKRKGMLPVEIDFKEYMGERACNYDDYKKTVIGDPRGAMILLNPKMEILRDAKKRVDMISQIQDIINYLSEPGKRCESVAFVITASDLLTTSLKDYKDEFDSYKKEITNCLNTNQKFSKSWEEFEVTVTGELEDARSPRIARGDGNTSRKPFEWLIQRIESANRSQSFRRTVKRFVIRFCATVAIAACGFSIWYWYVDRESERLVKKVLSVHGGNLEKAIKERKAPEINKLCNEMEKGRASLPTKKIVFDSNKVRHKKELDNLVNIIDKGRVTWYPLEIARFEREMTDVDKNGGLKINEYKNRSETVAEFGKKVNKFSVGSKDLSGQVSDIKEKWDKALQKITEVLEDACCVGFKRRMLDEDNKVGKLLLGKDKVIEGTPHEEVWNAISKDYKGLEFKSSARKKLEEHLRFGDSMRSNLFVRIDQHNSDVLEQHFTAHEIDAATMATDVKCSEWRREIEAWTPFSFEGKQRQKKLLEDFDEKKTEWRCAYESKCFADGSQDLMAKLQKSLHNLDDGDALHAELLECKKYEMYASGEDALKFIDYKTRCETWEKIKQIRLKLLDGLQESQLNRIDPKGAKVPSLSKEDSDFLDAVLKTDEVLSEEEYAFWMDGLNKKIDKIREAWEKWQNGECANFIKSIEGARAAYDTLKQFESFYSDFPYAPNLTNVVEKVNSVVGVSLLEVIKETIEYRDTSLNALNDNQALMIRRERMNKTLNNLREICRATRRAGGRCSLVRETASYRFAEACLSKGNIDGGVAGAFKQRYRISRVDARLDYAPQPDAWTRKDGFPVNFKCVEVGVSIMGFDEAKRTTFFSIGPCEQLMETDNREWRKIWSGIATLEGSPWLDAILEVAVKDINKITGEKSASWRMPFQHGESLKFDNNQPYLEICCNLNFQRKTGDPNPKIYFRIYVTPSGYDFFELVKNHFSELVNIH